MLNGKFIAGILGVVFAGALLLRLALPADLDASSGGRDPERVYKRIVSMAPGITETLYAVGAGDLVVGVTRYCTYPPQAQEKTDIGGFYDPNYETIVHLKPDLVVLYPFHDEAQAKFAALGLETLVLDHRTLPGILESIEVVGDVTGRRAEAAALLDDLTRRAQRVQQRIQGLSRPRVLVSAGRDKGTGQLTEIYASGQNSWYNSLLEMAGATNAYTDTMVQFPTISIEGLIELDPDVIVEMVRGIELQSYSAEDIVAEWQTVSRLRAVQHGRVYVLGGDHTTVPGPRFVLVLEDLARVLHPEVDWDAP